MNIWQIAAGDPAHNYTRIFLDYDVMLIGPGRYGEFHPNLYRGKPLERQIRSFVSDPRSGDLVLLRQRREAVAVGRIPNGEFGGYQWKNQFGDVNGWDLQHCRRVVWSTDASRVLAPIGPVFNNYRHQIPTFCRVRQERIVSLADKLNAAIPHRAGHPLPKIPGPLSEEQFGIELFNAGLPNDVVERVIFAVRRIRRLSSWYDLQRNIGRPSERELVAHLVVPLMASLGWSEQLLAVEWQKVDLAVFRNTPRSNNSCVMICEAKRTVHPLETYEQAREYVIKCRLQNCRKVLTTDGVRILVFTKHGRTWPEEPDGYINFLDLRKTYLCVSGMGAVATIVSLLPSRIQ